MAKQEFKNGHMVTATVVSDTELVPESPLKSVPSVMTAHIKIIATTTGIRFASGQPIVTVDDLKFHLWQTNDQFEISFVPGKQNIHYRAENIGDTFVITF